MKILFNIISFVLLPVLFSGCGKDNYDAPESTLTGQITYNGEAVRVRGTGEAVRLQLFQDGWQKHDPIDVFVGQDGAFSAKLFDGEYKMVTRDGNGPWVNSRDTMVINLNGSTHIELKVTPFFTISGEQISVSGSSMKASFTIHQVVPAAKINKVMLVLSKTQFADDVNNIFRKDITDVSAGSVNLEADLSGNKEVDNAKSLYGRVGVLPAGADQAVYSAVVKLK